MNFNLSTVIVPKTIPSVNETHIHKKLVALYNAQQFLFFNFYPCVIGLSFDSI